MKHVVWISVLAIGCGKHGQGASAGAASGTGAPAPGAGSASATAGAGLDAAAASPDAPAPVAPASAAGGDTPEAAARAFGAAISAHDLAAVKAALAAPAALAAVLDCRPQQGAIGEVERTLANMDAHPHDMDGVTMQIEPHLLSEKKIDAGQPWYNCTAKQPLTVQRLRLDEHVTENGKTSDSHDTFDAVQLGGRWYLIPDPY